MILNLPVARMAMEKDFEKLPIEWVERIFVRLAEIYGVLWTRLLLSPNQIEFLKSTWCAALSGLTAPEIQKALTRCQAFPHEMPPNQIEFYHYAKGVRTNSVSRKSTPAHTGDPAKAREHLDLIMSKLKSA
jgi:hypothetical protein